MPFGVSQWPYSPDPRQPDFGIYGLNFGQVPAWAWTLSTTNATGLAAVFNAGVIVKPVTILAGQTVFENVDDLGDLVTCSVKFSGFLEPFGPSFDETFIVTPIIRQDGDPEFSGLKGWLYPDGIRVFDGIDMTKVGIGTGTMPDPMKITPEIWDI